MPGLARAGRSTPDDLVRRPCAWGSVGVCRSTPEDRKQKPDTDTKAPAPKTKKEKTPADAEAFQIASREIVGLDIIS